MKKEELRKQIRCALNNLYNFLGKEETICSMSNILDERTITIDEEAYRSIMIETQDDQSVKTNSGLYLIPKSAKNMKIKDYYKGWDDIPINPQTEMTFREFFLEGKRKFNLKTPPIAIMNDFEWTYWIELIDYLYIRGE